MCGIAGAVALAAGARIGADELARMAAALGHRGPDGSGTHLEPGGRVGLAHARLSIIDLAGGAQPMEDGAGSVWIVFNGEVFNFIELRAELEARRHRFRTASDTEVLIRAYLEWGDDFVARLNGQFAFALADRRGGRSRVLLVRDRAGILPLYHTRDRGRLLFASEVKALLTCLAAPPALCPRALGQIFTYWAPLGTRTAFEGVAEVPPGGMLAIEDGRVAERTWWRWSYPDAAEHEAAPGPDPEAAAEELAALLADAVRLRLRSDVPVGAYLSGGLDSSTLAALARAEAGERLQTFSIRFESPEFDEGAHQRRMAEHLDVAHAEILATPRGIADAFPAVIRHTETPILRAAPAPMFLLSGLARRAGFKVVLTGEGADEAFGGYDLFKEAKIRRFWARQPESRLRPLLLQRLYPWLGGAGEQPLGHLKAFYGAGIDDPERFDFSHLPRWRTTAQTRMFFTPAFAAAAGDGAGDLGELAASLPGDFARWHPFNRAQYLEATILLPKYLLNSQGDRMLMAHSVEGRFPFLDHRVIEFANRLHPRLKMRGLDEKHVLKRAAARLVPPEVLERPKQPYRAPDHAAFLGACAPDYVRELLSEDALRRTGVFDPARVGLLVRKLRAASASTMRDQMALMGILSTQLWCYSFTAMR